MAETVSSGNSSGKPGLLLHMAGSPMHAPVKYRALLVQIDQHSGRSGGGLG